MSSLDTTYYAETKKQLADIKKEFRNSIEEETKSIGVNPYDIEFDFSSTAYHITTQANNDWENDRVVVGAKLQGKDTFTLRIDAKNDYFGKDNKFVLFMNNDTREQIIEALQNVVVSKEEE